MTLTYLQVDSSLVTKSTNGLEAARLLEGGEQRTEADQSGHVDERGGNVQANIAVSDRLDGVFCVNVSGGFGW